jgi:hypothetical protein
MFEGLMLELTLLNSPEDQKFLFPLEELITLMEARYDGVVLMYSLV